MMVAKGSLIPTFGAKDEQKRRQLKLLLDSIRLIFLGLLKSFVFPLLPGKNVINLLHTTKGKGVVVCKKLRLLFLTDFYEVFVQQQLNCKKTIKKKIH